MPKASAHFDKTAWMDASVVKSNLAIRPDLSTTFNATCGADMSANSGKCLLRTVGEKGNGKRRLSARDAKPMASQLLDMAFMTISLLPLSSSASHARLEC